MRVLIVILCGFLSALPAFADCEGKLLTEKVFDAPLCIPSDPQRIVVLDPFYNLGMAFELGLPVAGAPLLTAQDPHLLSKAREAAVVDIGDAKQPSLEHVMALKPDLILGEAQLHAQVYETLSKVAPTVLVDVRNWKDHLSVLAAIGNRPGLADEALRSYENRVAAIKARLPDVTVSVVRVTPVGFHVYLDGPAAYAPYAVLHEAGISRTDYETTADNTVFKRSDWEEIGALDGDILLYVVVSGYDPAQDDALEAETLANPLWQMLPAVQAGRAYRVGRATWMGFNSVASAHRVLDDVERYILTAP